MADASIHQYVGCVVNPVLWMREVEDVLSLYLSAFFRNEIFNLSIIIFYNFMQAFRYNSCCLGNSRDLSSQVISLFSEEERICENGALQISREQYLNLSGSLNVSWSQIWKLGPLFQDAISNPVGKFVDTSAFCFLVRGFSFCTLTTFFAAFDCTLSYIIIFLSSSDFAEETDVAST